MHINSGTQYCIATNEMVHKTQHHILSFKASQRFFHIFYILENNKFVVLSFVSLIYSVAY